MSLSKTFLRAVTAVALIAGFLSATPIAAHAAESLGGHDSNSVELLTVGVGADLDYTCITDSTTYYLETQGWAYAPTLPNGLTYDPVTHHISGTPTQTGQFSLPNMQCDVFDAATNHIQASVMHSAGIIQVSDPIGPPPPSLQPGAQIILDPLNNGACEFAMTLLFPSTWDAGSMTVLFASGDSSATVHDKDIDRLVGHWIVGPSDLDMLPVYYPEDWSTTIERSGNNPGCGELMTVTVNYTVNGSPVETAIGAVKPIGASTNVHAGLAAQGGKCSIYLDYTLEDRVFDSAGYVGPVFVEVESLTGREKVEFVIEENSPGDDGRFTVNLTDGVLSYAYINGHTWNETKFPVTATGDFSCGVPVEVNLYASTWPGDDPWPIASNSADALIECGKGTWNSESLGFQQNEACPEAPIGSYVDTIGATATKPCPAGMTTLETGSTTIKDCFYPATLCGKGTFSPSGHDLADAPCLDAPIGSYVSVKGAMQATECPAGMTTEEPGAASPYDCFKPVAPTIAKLLAPKVAKFGASLKFSGKTDQGTNLNITATGPCTVSPISAGVNQNFKVTMAKKAGTCKLNVFAKQRGRYTSLAKSISIKVSKTGK